MTNKAFASLFCLTVTAGVASAEALDCVIGPRSIVTITTQEEGRIAKVLAKRGDPVAAGDLVVQIDDHIERLQLDFANVLANSDVSIRSSEARVEFRKKELARAERLTERNISSETVLEDAVIEARLSELALEEAELELRQAQTERDLAQARLERRKLTSPINGVVMSVDAVVGEFADRQRELMQIAEIDPLHVEVFAPARFHGRFLVGQSYEVQPAPPLEGKFDATVSVVDSVFNAASGTFGVRLTIPNHTGSIPAGIRCSLLIPTN